MARNRTKAPVQAGAGNFTTPTAAMQNGAQPWTQRGVDLPDSDEQSDGSTYFAGADKDQQPAVNSHLVKDANPMSDEEIGALIQQQLTDARSFIDFEVGPFRAFATEAYRGRVDSIDNEGNEGYEDQALSPSGRTQIASRDVRDTILGMMPDLMRMFTSSDDVVEFQPEGPHDVAMAEQATDYANFVFTKDNDGFGTLYSAIKDALMYKTGIVKVWWDDSEKVRTEHYTGLDPMGLQMLESDDDVESIEVIKEYEVTPQTIGVPVPTIDARVKRRMKKGRIRIEPLPPEEFLIDRKARSLDCESPSSRGFNVCAHRSMMTTSELVALGYDEDIVREHVTSPEMDMNVELIARQPWARVVGSIEGMNPSTQRVLYCEAYVWIDSDGDGIAELHRVCTLGPSYKVVSREPVEFVPFAVFHCDKEPHVFFGESVVDATADIQRIKTQVWRDSLDSLAQSIRPRMAVVEGSVNYEDILNNENGAVIRMRAPGMVQPLITPFVGQDAFGMIEYTDQVLEKRTGVSLQSMGLSADTLQSTTALAVQQQVSASQGRVELIARVLADGVRQVFKLILNLSVQNQDKPRTVQLRGSWTEIDPRYWNADMACCINVALGTGTTKDKVQALIAIKAAQEQILQTLGPQNPLVTLSQYSNTLTKIVELSGYKNAGQFFNQLPAGQPQPQGPQQPPKPDPEMMKIQAQQQNDQAQIQLQQQRLQFDQAKAAQENQRLRERDAAELALQQYEIQLKYQQKANSAELHAATSDVNSQRDQETRLATAAMGHLADAHQHVFNAQQPVQPGLNGFQQ